jgi:hypothetical protein
MPAEEPLAKPVFCPMAALLLWGKFFVSGSETEIPYSTSMTIKYDI